MSTGHSIAEPPAPGPVTCADNCLAAAKASVVDAAPLSVTLTESFEEISQEWLHLMRAGHAIPYHGLAWCQAWRTTLCQEDGSVPMMALVKDGDTPLMLLPLTLKTRFGVRVLRFLGASIGNQNTGLWDKDFYETVKTGTVRSLLNRICDEARADCLVLQNVPREWHGRAHPLVLETAQQSANAIYLSPVAGPFQELFSKTHSKSSRKNLTRKQRHLQDAGGYQVSICSQRDDIEAGLDAYLCQRETRARITGIPNAFSSPLAHSFLRRAVGLDQPPPAGGTAAMSIWTLSVAGAIRATYLCARQGSTLYAYSNSVSHDELLNNSPGLVLIREIIEQLCADPGIAIFDLGLGEERYKTSWSSPESLSDNRLAVTFMGQLYSKVQAAKLRLKAAIRNSSQIWPLVRKLRKLRAPDRNTGAGTGTGAGAK